MTWSRFSWRLKHPKRLKRVRRGIYSRRVLSNIAKFSKLKELPSVDLQLLFKSIRIVRKKKKFSGMRRSFKPGRCLVVNGQPLVIPNTTRNGYHREGPFTPLSDGTKVVSFSGKLPIVEQLRKPRFESPHCSAFIQHCVGALPHELLDSIGSLSNIFLAVPTWFTSHEAFRLYGEYLPNYSPSTIFLKDSVFSGISAFVVKLKLPFIAHSPCEYDVYNVNVKPKSHPGVITRRQFFISSGVWGANKGQCLDFSMSIFMSVWALVHSGKINNASGTYCVGGREKVSAIKDTDKPISVVDAIDGTTVTGHPLDTRPVMIPEFHDILFDSVYASELMCQFKKYGCSTSDIWVGHSLSHGGWLKLAAKFDKSKFTFEGDASRFDRNMLPWVIELAFSMTRGCFRSGDKIDRAFKFMCDRFIHKKLVTPDGSVFQWSKGIPSGNVWTSWIGSLCTWIIWHYAFVSCPVFLQHYHSDNRYSSVDEWVKDNISFACYGDDLKFGSNFVLSKSELVTLEEWFAINFNYKIRADSTSCTSEVKDPELQTALLRVTLNQGLPSIKAWDLWEKLIFGPNIKGARYPEHIYMFDRISSLSISRAEDIRPVAFRACICYFLSLNRIDGQEVLRKLLVACGVGVDFKISTFRILCSLLCVSTENFILRLKIFESSVVRNFEKIFLSLSESAPKEHWDTSGDRVKLALLPSYGNICNGISNDYDINDYYSCGYV